MKNLIAIALTLVTVVTASAGTVQTSAVSKASALGQIADKNLAGREATSLLKSILEGQEYEGRVSIMETICSQKNTKVITCNVTIGVDDMYDGDNGWGTVYRLDYVIDGKGKVLGAALVGVAG